MNKRFNLPLCLPIEKITSEGLSTITLSFTMPSVLQTQPLPGQYFMIWNPGDDEIPISISNFESNNKIAFTICSEGETSNNLTNKNKSELIGLRGPFGNGFDIVEKGTVILVAGGMGIAPLRYLIYSLLRKENIKIILIHGAKTEKELFFKKELKDLSIENHLCTDDGSFGYKGFPTELLNRILKSSPGNKSTEIYSCGPELMLKAVLGVVKRYSLERFTQFSLADRYIRCGFGICGSCTLDDQGLTICHDGPVFRGDLLLNVKDFGLFGRKSDGSKFKI